MQIGETAWNPTEVGKVSLCAGLHGGRWSHRVVEVFQNLCLARIVKSVVQAANDVSRRTLCRCRCSLSTLLSGTPSFFRCNTEGHRNRTSERTLFLWRKVHLTLSQRCSFNTQFEAHVCAFVKARSSVQPAISGAIKSSFSLVTRILGYELFVDPRSPRHTLPWKRTIKAESRCNAS